MEFTSFPFGVSQLRKSLLIPGVVRAGMDYVLARNMTQPTFKSDRADKRDERYVFAKNGILYFFQKTIAVHQPHLAGNEVPAGNLIALACECVPWGS